VVPRQRRRPAPGREGHLDRPRTRTRSRSPTARRLPYSKLLLATGALPRHIDLPGADAEGVLYLRNREDSDAIRAAFGPGKRIAIIGAGWIGLEVAAAARQAGTEVVVVEVADLPLLNVLGPDLAQVFADLHRSHDVDLRLGTTTAEITVSGQPSRPGCDSATDRRSPRSRSSSASGSLPNVALASAAGLEVDNGVLVDASLRTSDPDIYAVGDIANHDHPVLGMRVRVEHWADRAQPAQGHRSGSDARQGRAVYSDLPYFYTDQYDLGMEYIGHAPRGSFERVVVRGDLASREFVAFWLDGGRTASRPAMNVNVWDVVDEVKPLILGRRRRWTRSGWPTPR
jgi:3-phenylpropionate/trans-cinnamate dioxygenase ferredoxin reductase subunit